MDFGKIDHSQQVYDFIIKNTEIVSFPIVPEIRLRILTEHSTFFYAKEEEFTKFGIVDPFFLFCWPGGLAVTRYLLDNKEVFDNKRVLIFGAGCGIEGVASALIGAKYVIASDIDRNALVMSLINMRLNNVSFDLSDEDFFDSDCKDFDVILAGDMFYDNEMTGRIINWLKRLKGGGKFVLCADPLRGNIKKDDIEILSVYRVNKDGEFYSNRMVETYVFSIK